MIAIPYTFTDELSFKPDNNQALPCNIEAELHVLSEIMDDRNAISRVQDRLKPEHFYVGAHKDIYQACLKLYKKGQPTDLLHVTSWLSDHKLLGKIGGRNALANIVSTPLNSIITLHFSTGNIESLAAIIIINAKRREGIKTAHQLEALCYDTQTEWTDVCITFENKVKEIISAPVAPTKEENESWHCNQLIHQLENIYLKESNPALKLYRLNLLANAHPEIKKGITGLEDLYMKSLCATVEPRKTLDELEEEVGTEGRKWLLGGILAQATTALVIADGGIGKTKWLYDLLHCIAEGKNWNGFPATADSRRVLIYQGDESKHDMLQALNKRGFKPGTEVRQRTAVRFGWNTDAMPILYQDAAEFQPAVVMIDSLTFANRYSLYDENRTEYSRCVLELNKFAAQTGITVVIIHHTNKSGGSRGSTAIRNAVSEVIKLEKDSNPSANPQEKILTIEKSRSRRFPASYRLFFNEEDFSFSLLEEVGQELGSPDLSTKDKIVKFLQKHANEKFEAEEIAHHINTTPGNARRCCLQLARDGIVTLDEKSFSGTRKLYYIARESKNCSTETPLPIATIELSPLHNSKNTSNACQESESPQSGDVYNLDCTTLHNYMHNSDAQLLNNSVSLDESASQSDCNGVVHLSMLETEKKPELPLEEKTQIIHAQLHNSIAIPENDCLASTLDCKEVVQGSCARVVHEIHKADSDRLKDNSHVIQTTDKELPILPLLLEKGSYWSKMYKREVEVFQIYDEFSEASCQVPGQGRFSLPFTDLQCLSQSPRSELGVGDKVVIDYGKHKDTFATITRIKADGIRLKLDDCPKPLARAYFPHQLVKAVELKVGDEVAVLSEHKKFIGRVFTISAIHPGGIWIEEKTRTGTKGYGPYQSSQLRKLSG